MRYKVIYVYTATEYGFEGEEYQVQYSNCKRYFDSFTAKENFLQEFDMASEVGDYIISEEQISDLKSNLYYGLAAVLYAVDFVTIGKFHKYISNGFYNLMDKTLRNIVIDPLCERFDQLIRFSI